MKKPVCVLVHGWGMPLTIFSPLIDRLQHRVRFHVVELPGDNAPSAARGWDAYMDFVRAQVLAPACWLGWSFGGLLAAQLAYRYPESVQGLFLVTATPKFVQADDWPDAVAAQTLVQFQQQMHANYQKTMRQFLALQVLHSPDQHALGKALKQQVQPHPDMASLDEQLSLLQHTDIRPLLPEITQPTLWLMGEHDMLTPALAGVKASKMMPQAQAEVLTGGTHLPFWTHAQAFDAAVLTWLEQIHG